ncbi:Na/Pi cotransporter family protein [Luteibaculum oceani]|nr:Na/Pi cotransporter family protein [Luteibaculum oceani]
MDLFFIVLKCFGALALFIYGMKTMSEGIQKLAGKNLRSTLNRLTNNRVTSIFTGLLTTGLVQSSSAISVLVVGFVHAGIIKLRQAMGVIMGANIGTTSTAVLVTALGFTNYSINTLALPMVALGLPLLFSKKDSHRSLSSFLIGFSILLLSIEFLRDAIPGIDLDAVSFVENISSAWWLSSIAFILTGFILTLLLQSSSATMALTLVLCEQEAITLEFAGLMVVGANIGTTITANIAAVIANAHGKRVARFHSLFNIIGALWFVPALAWMIRVVTNGIHSFNLGMEMGFEIEKWILVILHISFNVITTLLIIPFVPALESWLEKWIQPKTAKDEKYSLEYIDSGVMKTPELALLEVTREITKLAKESAANCKKVSRLLETTDRAIQEEILAEIRQHEAATDKAEEEVTKYLSRLTEDVISNETSLKVGRLLSIINDIETIGDLYYQITKIFDRKIEKEIYFLPNQRDGIKSMIDLLEEANQLMINNMLHQEGRTDNLEHAYRLESAINKKRNSLRKLHLKGIESGDFNIKSAMVFSELYTSIERIGDHVLKINEAHAGIMS